VSVTSFVQAVLSNCTGLTSGYRFTVVSLVNSIYFAYF